jgi:hypothetical protein
MDNTDLRISTKTIELDLPQGADDDGSAFSYRRKKINYVKCSAVLAGSPALQFSEIIN